MGAQVLKIIMKWLRYKLRQRSIITVVIPTTAICSEESESKQV
jgi:hypothetical protein